MFDNGYSNTSTRYEIVLTHEEGLFGMPPGTALLWQGTAIDTASSRAECSLRLLYWRAKLGKPAQLADEPDIIKLKAQKKRRRFL